MTIKFGTDGWRAVISDEFTFANVRQVAQAIGEVFLEDVKANRSPEQARNGQDGRPLVVVGFDTRFLSDRYAIAVSEVLAAQWPARRPRQSRRPDAGGLVCHPESGRRRRRDDHGQPQSAAL